MSNQDIIFINELTVETTIGVYEWEKAIKQKLVFNIELFTDTSISGASDNVDDTIDYALLSEDIINFVSSNKFELIELVAEKVSAIALNIDKVTKVKLTVNKPKAVAAAKTVGVCIERSK